MFEKLGYEDVSYNYPNKDFIEYQDHSAVIYTIVFVKEYKCVEILPKMNNKERKPVSFTRLDMELLKAINKQIEELEWNK